MAVANSLQDRGGSLAKIRACAANALGSYLEYVTRAVAFSAGGDGGRGLLEHDDLER